MKILKRNKGRGSLLLGLAVAVAVTGCDLPPPETEQNGYRGLAMGKLYNPQTMAKTERANVAPAPLPAPPDDPSVPKASTVYQNVEMLGDLNVGQFNRLMTAMTSWVSPEAGCSYCHVDGDLASDDKYTKRVARAMISMTLAANTKWKAHTGETGVTCYTCHRGKAVPEYVWSENPGPKAAGGMARSMTGQNLGSESAVVAYTSLPYDPFTEFLAADGDIRVTPRTALPDPDGHYSTMDLRYAEKVWGLMMHFTQALGVNCTFCHNTRTFETWEESPPQRIKAWHGIRQVREMNQKYVQSVADILPESRKGPLGDPLKVNCATCHQGAHKPLFGAKMLKDYPSLGKEASG